MTTESPVASTAMRIEVSADRLTATLAIDAAACALAPAQVMEQLQRKNLRLPADFEQRLASSVDAAGHVCLLEPMVCATGVAPVDDVPARVDLLLQDAAAETSTSFYERTKYVCAAVDQVVGVYVPRLLGEDGVDVYGKPIRRKSAPDLKPVCGPNVRLSADEKSIIASTAGRVYREEMRVWIEPALDVRGDVDFSTGNITFAGDLAIGGSVLDLFKVTVGGAAQVGKNIEAAEVSAGKDLVVGGAILGKEKGQCKAGGAIRARHATSARLEAGGDVILHSELADCTVRAGGRVVVEKGAILSGHIIATSGVSAAVIGSASQAKVVLEVGIDEALREQCSTAVPAIEERRRKAAKVRETIAPLLQHQKTLSAAQKEKATELLYEADEVETAARKLLDELRTKYESYAARCKAQVETTHTLHAGVTLRFPHCEVVVPETITGEARIVEKHTTKGWGAFLVRRSGNVVALPSRSTKDDPVQSLARLVQAGGAK